MFWELVIDWENDFSNKPSDPVWLTCNKYVVTFQLIDVQCQVTSDKKTNDYMLEGWNPILQKTENINWMSFPQTTVHPFSTCTIPPTHYPPNVQTFMAKDGVQYTTH